MFDFLPPGKNNPVKNKIFAVGRDFIQKIDCFNMKKINKFEKEIIRKEEWEKWK